jgi:hypothetical protein
MTFKRLFTVPSLFRCRIFLGVEREWAKLNERSVGNTPLVAACQPVFSRVAIRFTLVNDGRQDTGQRFLMRHGRFFLLKVPGGVIGWR